jgi:hypothetical protein
LSALQSTYLSKCADAQRKWETALTSLRKTLDSSTATVNRAYAQFPGHSYIYRFDQKDNEKDDDPIAGCVVQAIIPIFSIIAAAAVARMFEFFNLTGGIYGAVILAIVVGPYITFIWWQIKGDAPPKDHDQIEKLRIAMTSVVVPACQRTGFSIDAVNNILHVCRDANRIFQKSADAGLSGIVPESVLNLTAELAQCDLLDSPQFRNSSLSSLTARHKSVDRWFQRHSTDKSFVGVTNAFKQHDNPHSESDLRSQIASKMSSASSPVSKAPPTPLSTFFWIKRGNKSKGPISLSTMIEYLAQKKIKVSDKIGESEDGPWKDAASAAKRIRAMAKKS